MTAVPARDLSSAAPPVILRPSTGRAIALVIVAVSLFSLSDVLAKRLSEHASTLQVGWLRYVAFAVVAIAMASRAVRHRPRQAPGTAGGARGGGARIRSAFHPGP
jgi:drug/metabolite transporter (DMT)-like permease